MIKLQVLVIGAGTAGEYAAQYAKKGADSVGIVEKYRVGGDCIFHACMPTKCLIHAARTYKKSRAGNFFGLPVTQSPADYKSVKAYKDRIIRDMLHTPERLTAQGIRYFQGTARFQSPHVVTVGGEQIEADKIIIAAGSIPAVPPIPGLQETGCITNIEALDMDYVPPRLAVIGGGPIGAEFALIFSAFGARVHIYEALDRILSNEDEEVSAALSASFIKQGIAVSTSTKVVKVEKTPSGKLIYSADASGKETQEEYDEIMVAAGRKPDLVGMNLDVTGVKLTRRGITVDNTMQTSVPHIYAVGDVTDTYQFTHIAWEQGEAAGGNAVGRPLKKMDYSLIPHVTYCDPEVAGVGLTEKQARDAGLKVKTAKWDYSRLRRAIITGDTEGFIKVIAEDGSGRILGVYIIGQDAGEIIQEATVAIAGKMTVSDVGRTFNAYPSFSEGIRFACQKLR